MILLGKWSYTDEWVKHKKVTYKDFPHQDKKLVRPCHSDKNLGRTIPQELAIVIGKPKAL